MRAVEKFWMFSFAAVLLAGLAFFFGAGKSNYGQSAKAQADAAVGAAGAPATVEVKIDNFSFTPAELKIAAGTTVTWTNRDDIPHTVVSEEKGVFKSKALDTDEKFSFTFDKPGTYAYFCSVHPKMVGKVVVQ